MAPHHVLLLGGHGKVAQYLTPLLLQRSWAVTSIIRDPSQVPAVQKLADKAQGNKPGDLNVLVRSLEDVKSEAQAKAIIDEVQPDYIVWSAGTLPSLRISLRSCHDLLTHMPHTHRSRWKRRSRASTSPLPAPYSIKHPTIGR